MPMPPDVPEVIQNAALLIRRTLAQPVLTRQDREAIHNARLKIVFWACAAEHVAPNRDNLSYILGPDAQEVMAAYDQKVRSQKLPGANDSDVAFWDK